MKIPKGLHQSFPKALKLTNYVTQLKLFNRHYRILGSDSDPASESNKMLFKLGTEALIKKLGSGE